MKVARQPLITVSFTDSDYGSLNGFQQDGLELRHAHDTYHGRTVHNCCLNIEYDKYR